MDNLIIENPTKLTDTSFKITINGEDFEYEISEEKDIDAVIDKLDQWIDRGEDSFGGLYDYIKKTFKLVGKYEEPVEEFTDMEEPIEEPEIDLPSDLVNPEEPVANQLDLNVDIEENEVQISINEWSAKFTINDTEDEKFTDMLTQYVKDEMTLKDRTELIIELAKTLEANDIVDFYNLINLILDTGVEIVNSFDEVEEPEEEVEEAPLEGPAIQEESEELGDLEEPEEEVTNEEDDKLTLEELIGDNSFIQDLIKLDLSLFEIVNRKTNDKIYFIGGINDIGNKFSLSYTTEPPIELLGQFDELKDIPECLNNIEDLDTVVDYVNKLLDIVYNKELGDMEEDNE